VQNVHKCTWDTALILYSRLIYSSTLSFLTNVTHVLHERTLTPTGIEAVWVVCALPWLVVGEVPGFLDVRECGFVADRAG